MLNVCISKLSVDIDRTLSMNGIWETLSEEQLIILLTSPGLETRGGELRLRVICNWIDGGKMNNQLTERLDRFRQLLNFIDLASITYPSLVGIISSSYAVMESRRHQ